MSEKRKRKTEKSIEDIIEERIEDRIGTAVDIGAEVERRIEGKIESKKKRKRNALLEGAYELFTTKGFSNTAIRDITRAAGVAKGTFYLYYEDKDAILRDLMRLHSSRLLIDACTNMENLKQSERDSMSVADKFIFITDYIVDRVSEDTALLKLVSKNLSWGLFDPSGEDETDPKIDESELDFESYIASMLEVEGIVLQNPRLLIFTLLQMTASTCYDAMLYKQPVSLADYKPYLYNCIRLLVEDAIAK